jgi:hypothetical protein
MKLDVLFKSVVSAFCFLAGGAAMLFIVHGMFSLLFWSTEVFATIFCIVWALHSYSLYRWGKPEWGDRARILIRMDDDDDEDDDGGGEGEEGRSS